METTKRLGDGSEGWGCPFESGNGMDVQGEKLPGDDSTLGTLGQPENATLCITQCRINFIQNLIQGVTENDFDLVCKELAKEGTNQQLGDLYCCDYNPCGVWIDSLGGTGQDPNVDLIINRCQDIGFRGIDDPGPPSPDYCSSWHQTQSNLGTLSCNTQDFEAEEESKEGFTVKATLSTENGRESPATTGEATLLDPATFEIEDEAANKSSSSSPASGISTSAKIAASICSVLGLVGIMSLIIFLLHRRRRNAPYVRNLRDHIKHGPSLSQTDSPNSISPTPLITPTTSNTAAPHLGGAWSNSGASRSGSNSIIASAPLTPPLRLRDRRILVVSNILRSTNTPTTPTMRARTTPTHLPVRQRAFPTAPYCAPTTSKLVPRHERTPKIYSSKAPFLPSVGMGLNQSNNSNPSTRDGGVSAAGTPPSSPTRPRRPHDINSILETSDLIVSGNSPSTPIVDVHTIQSASCNSNSPPSPSSSSSAAFFITPWMGGERGRNISSSSSSTYYHHHHHHHHYPSPNPTSPNNQTDSSSAPISSGGMIGLAITDPDAMGNSGGRNNSGLSLRGELNAPAPNPPPTRALPATPTSIGSGCGVNSPRRTSAGGGRGSKIGTGGGGVDSCAKKKKRRSSMGKIGGRGVVVMVQTAPGVGEERGVIVVPGVGKEKGLGIGEDGVGITTTTAAAGGGGGGSGACLVPTPLNTTGRSLALNRSGGGQLIRGGQGEEEEICRPPNNNNNNNNIRVSSDQDGVEMVVADGRLDDEENIVCSSVDDGLARLDVLDRSASVSRSQTATHIASPALNDEGKNLRGL